MASGDNQTVDSLAIGDIAANWCFTHKSPFPAGDRGPSLMQTVLERDLWRPRWHCVIQCHEHPCQMASYSIQQPLQGARVWQTTYREIDCIVVTLCHSGWNLTWESLPLSRLSRLGRSKSSQVKSFQFQVATEIFHWSRRRILGQKSRLVVKIQCELAIDSMHHVVIYWLN